MINEDLLIRATDFYKKMKSFYYSRFASRL